jgi:thiosulfate/3-mercaptopyruvate sulfurtransferase
MFTLTAAMKENRKQKSGRVGLWSGFKILFFGLGLICCVLTTLAGCGKTPVRHGEISKIETGELPAKIGSPDWQILDLRPKASFNGWQLFGEGAKGHIKGAISFPAAWIREGSISDLKRKLAETEIIAENLIVYHAHAGECEPAAERLASLGYSKIFIYEDFHEWASNPEYPMEFLPNFEKLVHADWLNDLISGKAVPSYSGDKFLVLEVAWGPPDAYNMGHIPGAIHLNTDEIESLPAWKFRSDGQIESVLKDIGITRDTLVVVYSNDTSAATRTILCFMRAGVTDVRLLDGGWNAWTAARHRVETGTNSRVPVTDTGFRIPVHPEYIVDTAQVKDLLKQPSIRLATIRKWDEFIGKISGYSYIEAKGSVPGSVWGHDNEELRDWDGRMADYNKIVALWDEWDIRPDNKTILYCGTGWRASEAWFYTYLMGWPDVVVYDSGWMDWSLDPSNPIQTGDPRKTVDSGQK